MQEFEQKILEQYDIEVSKAPAKSGVLFYAKQIRDYSF